MIAFPTQLLFPAFSLRGSKYMEARKSSMQTPHAWFHIILFGQADQRGALEHDLAIIFLQMIMEATFSHDWYTVLACTYALMQRPIPIAWGEFRHFALILHTRILRCSNLHIYRCIGCRTRSLPSLWVRSLLSLSSSWHVCMLYPYKVQVRWGKLLIIIRDFATVLACLWQIFAIPRGVNQVILAYIPVLMCCSCIV